MVRFWPSSGHPVATVTTATSNLPTASSTSTLPPATTTAVRRTTTTRSTPTSVDHSLLPHEPGFPTVQSDAAEGRWVTVDGRRCNWELMTSDQAVYDYGRGSQVTVTMPGGYLLSEARCDFTPE